MKILAIEFSGPQRSVAFSNGESVFEITENATRDTDAFGMIEKVLRTAHAEREQVECLAVGLGPGSYYGIRAAIALAQGWQLANGVKILGINSAETIAAQAQAEKKFGNLRLVLDAQRNEFYVARYEVSAAGCREIEPLRIATLAEVRAGAQPDEILTGPEITRWFPSGKISFPTAAMAAKLAASRNNFVAGEKLEPVYLRETTFVKSPPLRTII